MTTCIYVDPDNNRCQKDASFEIIEADNVLYGYACPDHKETMLLAAKGRSAQGLEAQAAPLNVSDPPVIEPLQPAPAPAAPPTESAAAEQAVVDPGD